MRRLALLVPLFILLAACGNKPDAAWTTPPEVTVYTEPSELKAGGEAAIKAKVTQGGEPVDDADEVLFEIWPEGADEFAHEEIEGTLEGEGVYAIRYSFPSSGTYYVVAHVTARTFHVMPKIELKVE